MTSRIRPILDGERLENLAVHFAGGIAFLPPATFVQQGSGAWDAYSDDGSQLLFLEQTQPQVYELPFADRVSRSLFTAPVIRFMDRPGTT